MTEIACTHSSQLNWQRWDSLGGVTAGGLELEGRQFWWEGRKLGISLCINI